MEKAVTEAIMAKSREWFPDPVTFLTEDEVTIPPATQGDPDITGRVRVVDAYSQWISTYGAQFAFTNEIPKVDEKDFNFALIVVERNQDIVVLAKDFNFTDPPFVPRESPQSDPIEDVFLGRLPIRASSAGDEISSGSVKGFGNLRFLPEVAEPEKLVIVGLIDDAINFGHRRFRDQHNRSRVDFAWIHDAPWNNPSSVPFGLEVPGLATTLAIQDHPNDDDALMRELDLIATEDRPYLPTSLRLRGSHGTHVSDLAAGYDPDEADAFHRRIVAVQLPTFASQDTSGASLMASIIAAADYIFLRALQMSEHYEVPIPVVLNFSYGFGGGPRNGAHIVERALRKQAETYRRKSAEIASSKHPGISAPAELVLPAGNGHLTRTHAVGSGPEPDQAPTLEFDLRIQPEDRSPSFVEIWFSAKTRSIEVTVTPPHGAPKSFEISVSGPYTNEVSLCNDFVLAEPKLDGSAGFEAGSVVVRFSIDRPNEKPPSARRPHQPPEEEDGTPFWRVVLAIGPSSCLSADQPPCPHGIWSVVCRGHEEGRGEIQAWIQRDEAVGGFGERGRQAYFDDTIYENNRFDEIGDVVVTDEGQPASIVKRDGTVSGIATNPAGEDNPLLTIGGALWDSDRTAVYSAAGNDRERSAPHFLAPSDTSRVLTGIHATTTRNGGQVAMGGTSVAVPQVARCLADELESLEPARYSTFNARNFLKDDTIHDVENPDRKARPVLRPDSQIPERAGNRRVREERVRYENGLIKPHPELAKQTMRQTERKV
ncbi:hypothetical protein [uncultured Roseobacter sp.]|uniref:hypothetical protein n=1 Tax=uncultured Roseobacter sp. TaxID=114847 RepID=UPI002609F10B|nr:hypothetical protein [uncultured Roseobacter sp.]